MSDARSIRMTSNSGPVLIVDDDADFRAFADMLLSRAGYATLKAASGTEALQVAREFRPVLVVLEVSLPDINGFEVCRELRDEFNDRLPIIFVSGKKVEAVDRATGLLVGGDDYVVKPFDADEFLARARRAIVRSHRERSRTMAQTDFELTNRETEVLQLLAEGQTPSEIANDLIISAKTVASHIQRILAKLGVHSRAQAVAVAYQAGILKKGDAAK